MSTQSVLAYLVWVAPQPLLVFLAMRMVRNRLAAETPVFFAYVLFSLAKFAIRFAIYHLMGGGSIAYFDVYWTLVLVDAIFVLAVIHELYALVFGAYEGLTRFASGLFKWSAAVLILVAAVTASSRHGSDLSRLVFGIATLDRSAALVQLGLITLLFVVTSSLWLVWQRHLFGIAMGLAVIVSIEVVTLALTIQYGQVFTPTWFWVKNIAYSCGILLGTVHFLRRETPVRLALREDDYRLQEWNAALLKLLER